MRDRTLNDSELRGKWRRMSAGPKARPMPAWANGPGRRPTSRQGLKARANGGVHRGIWIGPSALPPGRRFTWAVGPGWHGPRRWRSGVEPPDVSARRAGARAGKGPRQRRRGNSISQREPRWIRPKVRTNMLKRQKHRMKRQPLRRLLVFTALVLSMAGNELAAEGASPNVAPVALASLRHGLTQHQVAELLKARGDHQFTAVLSNGITRCVSYYRNDVYGHYHLVFTNDHLAGICEPPPSEQRKEPYKGTWAIYRVMTDPEARLAAVLRSEDMIGPRLTAALKPKTPPKRSVDPGLTAAFLLAQKLAGAGSQSARERKFSVLVKQFDPYEVALGSPLTLVERRLGRPHITEPLGAGREIRYYGSIEFGMTGSKELMWLSVVYADGKVIRVFSRDFIDKDKIRPLEEKSLRKTNH